MRRPLPLCLALGCIASLCGTVQAQQQESRIEKILKADRNQSFDLSREKRFGTNSFDATPTTTVNLKKASWPQKFNTKEFLTGNFRTDKSFWMGDFKYSTDNANTKPRIPFALSEKAYDTKAMAVNAATGTDKRFTAAEVPTRDFRGPERKNLKKALTPEQQAANAYDGTLTELKSIDDVRALLNKSK